MGIYRSEIADLRKNIGENIGQKIIIKESPGKRSKPQEKAAIIRDLDTENTKSLVSYKVAKQKSEDISKEIDSFDYLPDLKTKLDNMKILMNRYKSLELLKTSLEGLSNKRINLINNK